MQELIKVLSIFYNMQVLKDCESAITEMYFMQPLQMLVQKVANGKELDASREALYSEYYKSIMYVKSTDLNIRMQRIMGRIIEI